MAYTSSSDLWAAFNNSLAKQGLQTFNSAAATPAPTPAPAPVAPQVVVPPALVSIPAPMPTPTASLAQPAPATPDYAGILSSLYQTNLGRTPDQAGYDWWLNAAKQNNFTPDQLKTEFLKGAQQELVSKAAPSATVPGTTSQPSNIVLGKDLTGMTWDDLLASVTPGGSGINSPEWDGNWQRAGSPSNVNIKGFGPNTVQAYTYEDFAKPLGAGPDSGYQTNTIFNLKDSKNAPEGYMTQLYRKPDGSIGVGYYEEKNGFLKDMALFIATAATMGAGISAMGGASAGAGASGTGGALGTGASGAGELAALPTGGMTATGTTAPWVSAGEAALGSGLTSVGVPGISTELLGTGLAGSMTAAPAIPGMTYGLGGSIMAGAEGTLSTAAGPGSAVTNFVNTGAGLTPLSPWYPTAPTIPPTGGAPTPPSGTPSSPTPTTPPGGAAPPTTPPVIPPGVTSTIGSILTNPLTPTIAGAVLGGANGSQQSGKTTTTVEPWEAQQPYLKDLYANAQGIFNANKNPSSNEVSALNAIQQRAQAGSPLQTAAKSNIQGLLGQDPTKAYGIGQANQYLGQTIDVGTNPMLGMNNPFLQNAIDAAQEDVTRAMQPQFAAAQRASGSFGNSGLQETYARELPKALGNISNSMRMQDYGTQQQLQENALNRSVAAQQADLTRNSGLAQQGIQNNLGQYNTMLGLQTDAAYRAPGLAAADYNDPQMAYNTAFGARQNAFMPLQQYQSAISGNVGSSTSSPYFTNPAANILGGATAGLGLWNAAQKSGLFGSSGGGLADWFGNNVGVANSTGLGWSDLMSAF